VRIGNSVIQTRHSQSLIPGTAGPKRKAPPCNGTRADGLPCRQRAIAESGEHGLCGMHWNRVLEHRDQLRVDLKEYERYQRIAFENIVMILPDDDLKARRRALADIAGDEDDTHFRRLRAERDAIGAELKRRSAR
jgi:hypothetical protein